MRKNPYIKDLKDLLPLFMQGPSTTTALTESEAQKEFCVPLTSIKKEGYCVEVKASRYDEIWFTMVRPPFMLGSNGFVPTNIYNIEMCDMQVTRRLFKEIMGWENSYYRESKELPVDSVAWYDCIKFCNKLSELLGFKAVYEIANEDRDDWNDTVWADVTWDEKANGFRLPTEQEWEAFAKAGTENRWAGTDDYKKVYDYAWLFNNSGYETHVVGSKKPNEWGLYDMTGNVSEWCWDEVGDKGYKVTKGGDQRSNPNTCITTDRSPQRPSQESHITGFRICRTIKWKETK